MMLTKTGGECVQWGWEEEEEEKEEEFEERNDKEDAGGGREEGGEDIEKVLFDSVTTRTRGGSVMKGGNRERSDEVPRRGVPREASSQPDLDSPPTASSAFSSFSPSPTLLSLFLCISLYAHL